jgi:hypothetical protein
VVSGYFHKKFFANGKLLEHFNVQFKHFEGGARGFLVNQVGGSVWTVDFAVFVDVAVAFAAGSVLRAAVAVS